MSEHDLTLRALSTEYTRQATRYVGKRHSWDLEGQVLGIGRAYCKQLKARWGIEAKPVVTWDAVTGIIEMNIEYASILDEALIAGVMENEGLTQ
ncbi:hypothetical protein [Methylobacterium sp. WL120]|uniref:hypothetical protein n=1 Tax=Methylobacterium sp. WL120 TaxID=2603887 RepID=UPI0011C9EA98|nr:hypothetical protein [Methylobacterium sp. WL120]TXM68314.1 hypothetical protein FV229_08060 [Methylobacterium sp. WL120]